MGPSCWETIGRPGRQVGTVAAGHADDLGARWTRCGDLAGNTGAMRRFTDEVDAGILDRQPAGARRRHRPGAGGGRL